MLTQLLDCCHITNETAILSGFLVITTKVEKRPIIQLSMSQLKSSKLSKHQQAVLGTHVLDVPIAASGYLSYISSRRATPDERPRYTLAGNYGCGDSVPYRYHRV